jgi:putative peptidoglycan lipid II flippase
MNHIARSSLIVAFFFGIDKLLGFGRQLLVARQFSLSYNLDVFNAANNIPDLLSALISGGALGIALIPVLSEFLQKKGREGAWDLFSRILNLAFLVTAAVSIVIALFAPWLVSHIIAPGFPAEQKSLTVELMRLDLLAIIIFSISGLVMAGLQSNQHFLLPAMAPALYNIGQIFGVTILSPANGMQIGPITLPSFGLGIHGLVYGVILGALLHLLIQVPGLLRYRFRWAPRIDLRNPGVRQVLILLGPRIMTMFFIQVFFIVRDNLASRLGEGSVTALNLGWFIMQVPETLLGSAFAIVLLPTISELFASGDTVKFQQTVNTSIRTIVAITIPVAALLSIGIKPLVSVAFGFDEAGTQMIILATRIYLIGMAAHALLEIATRTYYAQKNALIPLYAAAINAVAYVVLAILLSRWLGFAGIALANILAFSLEAFLLLFLLNRTYPKILASRSTILRVIAGTATTSLALFILLNSNQFSSLLLSLFGMLAGLALFVPFIFPEIRSLLKLGEKRYQLNIN